MTLQEAEKYVEGIARQLGEHFEAVQILVSWVENGTQRVYGGTGNWYARQGMAQDFVNLDLVQENAFHIAEKLKEEDDK